VELIHHCRPIHERQLPESVMALDAAHCYFPGDQLHVKVETL